jgi:hypothetical protein
MTPPKLQVSASTDSMSVARADPLSDGALTACLRDGRGPGARGAPA